MKTEIFIKRSGVNAPAEVVFQWHSRSGVLERLSPPWDPIEVIDQAGGIETGSRVILRMKAGPIPYRWIAEHTDYIENSHFRDVQISGPFSRWTHTHTFESTGSDDSILEDRIEYALPFYPFGDLLAGIHVHNRLERIFNYRHSTTIQDISAYMSNRYKNPMNILVSGASGLLGSVLVPFLKCMGHSVFHLVRRTPRSDRCEIYWDPLSGRLDHESLTGLDAVIHLAGENIGEGVWTDKKKKKIIESRTKGTALLVKALLKLDPPPEVLVSASAIGYYGNRGETVLYEYHNPGNDFTSMVCREWETAAAPAEKKGIRVVYPRLGIVLTPAGGALKKLLPLFKMGLGAKIGSGNQFMSWVGIDDAIGSLYHMLMNSNMIGPVNVVSPHPIINREFTKILGKVLSRPAPFSIPALFIRSLFGEKGREMVLSSTRVSPKKLLEAGYGFRNPDLEGVLRHLLGKQEKGTPDPSFG